MRVLRRFYKDTTGNAAIISGLAMFPILAITGMSVDYTLASRRKVQLDAIADAAALMTTSPPGMAMTSTAAQVAASAMFTAQAANVVGATVQTLTPTVQDTTNSAGVLTRMTTVPYTAKSQNAFAGLLNMASINIGGISKVSGSNAPNIDFYLLLDTSPSMAIPSSQAGINTMVANTPQQSGGCAFACHATNPTAKEMAGNPPGMDNYTFAKNVLGLTLRIDLVKQSTANLIQTAANTQAVNNAKYRVATYTFDQSFKAITNLTSNLTQAQSDATSKIQMLEVYDKTHLVQGTDNNSEDTQFDQAMSNAAQMPNPGNGTNKAGDTPQEVLFIVTDGVLDEPYPNVGSNDDSDSDGRTITTVGHQTDWCTPLKKRGVRIAALYLTYTPLPNDTTYTSRVAPIQSQIAPGLQACASPGLFFQVDTGGDISSAMQALFVKAVGSAHLTQ